MASDDLTDAEWELIGPLLPRERGRPGRPGHDNRPLLDGILWRAREGARWRAVPERYGRWNTVRRRGPRRPPRQGRRRPHPHAPRRHRAGGRGRRAVHAGYGGRAGRGLNRMVDREGPGYRGHHVGARSRTGQRGALTRRCATWPHRPASWTFQSRRRGLVSRQGIVKHWVTPAAFSGPSPAVVEATLLLQAPVPASRRRPASARRHGLQ